ncbi:MAG: dienelactone hydrolase family protein [Chloroflexi bacterium]|nr:dienelactone hydrolase family protein [Chloroflexota bacterium]
MARYAARGEPVRYRVEGTWIGACLFRPDLQPPQPAIVLLHDEPGVDNHFLGLAERFAHVGYVTLAVDLYRGTVPASPAEAATLAAQVEPAAVMAHLSDALRWLRSQPFVRRKRIGSAGIGLGGAYALLLAVCDEPVQAAVSFGGAPALVAARADAVQAPLLGLFAAQDDRISAADIENAGLRLAEHAKPHDFVVYPERQRGFFDERNPSFHFDSAEDAWSRSNKFFYHYLGEPGVD